MDEKQKAFVDWLVKGCETHEQWLTVVDYGLATLLQDQDVLAEVMLNEASRLVGLDEDGKLTQPQAVTQILSELKLKFVAA